MLEVYFNFDISSTIPTKQPKAIPLFVGRVEYC